MKKFEMRKKSQTAIEFLILVTAVLFFFSVFFLVIQGNMSDKIKERQNLNVQNIALTIQDEINLASKSSDGYNREFKIPEKIGEQDYSVEIIENMAYVKTTDNSYAVAMPVIKITGQIIKGQNIIKKENNEIKLNVE